MSDGETFMKARDDARPPVAFGHVFLNVTDVSTSADFFMKLGTRLITLKNEIAVLELRGGTHLLLLQTQDSIEPGTPAPFDLMYDDVHAAREECLKLGMSCTETESTDFHDKFTITGPDGYLISAYSSHASEKPV